MLLFYYPKFYLKWPQDFLTFNCHIISILAFLRFFHDWFSFYGSFSQGDFVFFVQILSFRQKANIAITKTSTKNQTNHDKDLKNSFQLPY